MLFVANMTGNIIFLGFWFVPHSGVDLTAAAVAFGSFMVGTIIGDRFARYLDNDVRRWITAALGAAVLTMCGGAAAGATLSRFAVAPVIALAAVSVAAALVIFRFGRSGRSKSSPLEGRTD